MNKIKLNGAKKMYTARPRVPSIGNLGYLNLKPLKSNLKKSDFSENLKIEKNENGGHKRASSFANHLDRYYRDSSVTKTIIS